MIRIFLGGSFDPIHRSHFAMATAVHHAIHALALPHTISFLPTAGNPLKHAPTPNHHRLNMLSLVLQDTPFVIDTHEIKQTPPIYTIDTVRYLAKTYPDDKRIFVVGQDSLVNFDQWKDHQQILDYVDLWAFERVGSGQITPFLQDKLTNDLNEFLHSTGKIYHDPSPIPAMSSSQIRTLLAQGLSVDAFVDTKVGDYIRQHQLYVV